MVVRRAWLGSVGVIVISRKSEYRRSMTNARGVFNNKYLSLYLLRGQYFRPVRHVMYHPARHQAEVYVHILAT
jgi:hypothetical protein